MTNKQGTEAVYTLIAERKERLRVLNEERQALDGEIKGLELAAQAFAPADQQAVQVHAGRASIGDESRTFRDRVTDAIEEILWEERPLHRSEIFARVRAKGIIVEAKKTLQYFTTFLSQDSRFMPVRNKRGFWTLVASPEPFAPESC